MTPLLKAGLTLVLCLAVTGCSLAPEYKRPEQDIPKEWRSVDLGPSPLNTDWWTASMIPCSMPWWKKP